MIHFCKNIKILPTLVMKLWSTWVTHNCSFWTHFYQWNCVHCSVLFLLLLFSKLKELFLVRPKTHPETEFLLQFSRWFWWFWLNAGNTDWKQAATNFSTHTMQDKNTTNMHGKVHVSSFSTSILVLHFSGILLHKFMELKSMDAHVCHVCNFLRCFTTASKGDSRLCERALLKLLQMDTNHDETVT